LIARLHAASINSRRRYDVCPASERVFRLAVPLGSAQALAQDQESSPGPDPMIEFAELDALN
jgi:hypothetical protein